MFARLLDMIRMTPEKRAAADLYDAIVAAARQPALYREGGAPDTVDGRFDLIALHAFLLFHRLSGEERWSKTGDALANHIMKDMDRNLREMGVGDMSVGKKMKKLARAFYGRLDAYWGALKGAEPDALGRALARNVYRDESLDAAARDAAAERLAVYVRAQIDALAEQSTDALLAGRVQFLDAAPLIVGARPETPSKEAAE